MPKEERSRRSDELGHYAYLEIVNGEDEDLGDCYVTLNKVYLLTEDSHLDVLRHINPNLSYFSWPAFNREDEKIIRAKKSARVNVAKTISNNIVFTLEDGDHQGLGFLTMGEYYIEIEINGNLNKTPIQGVVFKGFIHYISISSGEPDRPPRISYRLYIEEKEYDET